MTNHLPTTPQGDESLESILATHKKSLSTYDLNELYPALEHLITAETDKAVAEALEAATKLWDLLDDIDTLPDMIKPVTREQHQKLWQSMVKKTDKRHAIMESDGYKLTLRSAQPNQGEGE